MTAEIALLNKSAVALAADSAATLSSRDRQEKVFNSEDKLFELSMKQPIGIMIFNSTTFMETPVHILIKKYRLLGREFSTVEDAATDFREYLRLFAISLDNDVRKRNFGRLLQYPMQLARAKALKDLQEKLLPSVKKEDGLEGIKGVAAGIEALDMPAIAEDASRFYVDTFRNASPANFTGATALTILDKMDKAASGKHAIKDLSRTEQELINSFLRSSATSSTSTGFVIAGFADNELFPSLRSFEVDGMLGDDLRYVNASAEDITLDGASAKILPFAQQEMVDRFVSGIDEISQSRIIEYCREQIRNLHSDLMGVLDLDDDDQKGYLEDLLDKASETYIQNLKSEGFSDIKRKSRAEMEGMVEFMPKVDLAQMAESLVELTSIKRRVSKGFETVGGPIDVAVISRSDGFVWIKRKHYFPSDLNPRYFERVRAATSWGVAKDGDDKQSSPVGDGAGSQGARRTRKKRTPAAERRADEPRSSSPA